ncbi:hypothetical protein D9M69_478810 [compost metagenome]
MLEMHLKDGGAPPAVGAVNQDLPIEAACAQQRWIENFGAVGRRQKHDAFTGIEAVQFGE